MRDGDGEIGRVYVSLAEAARALGLSIPGFKNYVDDPASGLPIHQRGANGRAYQFDLDAIAEWRAEMLREAEEESARTAAAVEQARFDLLGDDGPIEDGPVLSAKARLAELEVELKWSKVARDRRELISSKEVDEGVGRLLGMFAKRLSAMVDEVEVELGLSNSQSDILAAKIDLVRTDLADEVARLSNPNADVLM